MRLTLEKAIILKSVDLFSSVPEMELASVAAILKEIEVVAGDDIIVEGEIGSTMYVIVAGKVRVHRGGRDVAILGDREVFGELATLDPAPRSATVTALAGTELLELSAAALLELLTDHPGVTRGIFRVLCARLRAASAS